MKRIIYVMLLLVLLVLAACGIHEDEPWSETWLSVIDSDGNNLQHLVKDVYGNPKFSYDGKKIVIANNEGFHTVNSDGTDYTTVLDSLTCNEYYFSLSPIDEALVFYQNGNIYKLNYINGELLTLFAQENHSACYPSYSHDGLNILFSTTSSDIGDSTVVKLFRIDECGTNLTQIYNSISENFSVIRYPTYSENQDKILLNNTSTRSVQTCNPDGTSLSTITDLYSYIKSVSIAAEYFIFSSNNDIVLYNYVNEKLTTIYSGINPVISSDGAKIAFYDYDLYLADIDGDNRYKIANSSNPYQSFSPDGSKIVFLGDIKHNSKRTKNPLE